VLVVGADDRDLTLSVESEELANIEHSSTSLLNGKNGAARARTDDPPPGGRT
jgi:hypothetical protein